MPVLLLSIALLEAAGAAESPPSPRAPPGFAVSPAAREPEVVFPMFAALDERGRLFVAESSGLDLYAELKALTRRCRVRVLEDRDGDGRFESSRVFADGLVFPMGLAWRDGRLYVADPPELVALEDTDGDARADSRRTILSGFGHTDNGSLHGLTFGPDGLLYLTMGSPDGYRLAREDGFVLRGESGALLRCRPDGSRPEVISRGFDNLVEVAFLPGGEIIGTDNWFQLPEGGMRDALVHLVEGGLYPRQLDRGGPEQPITGRPLPAVALYPAVALSGLAADRGPAFPTELRGNLFSAQHNARKVVRHVLERDGSTFRSSDFDFVSSGDPDFHPSDVLFSAEGDLLVVDTGGWYVQHCPTGKIRDSRAPGGIWRVRFQAAPEVADPLGLRIEWPHLGPEELAPLLADPRPRARERAERSLAALGGSAVEALSAVLDGPADPTAKLHALSALEAIAADSSLPPLRAALRSPRPEIAARAARALALRGDRQAAGELCRLLAEGPPAVQLAAAEALARCGDARSVPALKVTLSGNPDRFLEHAAVFALHRLATRSDLEAALEDPSPRVEKAALLLLDQDPRGGPGPGAVLARLSASDPDLRSTAFSILTAHPAWAGAAAEFLRERLGKAQLPSGEEESLEGLALAFQAEPAFADLLAAALSGPEDAPAKRALRLLLKLARARPVAAPRSWVEGLARLLGSRDPALRAGAAEAVALLGIEALDAELWKIALDEREPEELRLEALRAAAPRRESIAEPVFRFLASRLEASPSPLGRLRAAEVLSRSRLSEPQLLAFLGLARGEPLVSPGLLFPALKAAPAGSAERVIDYLEQAVRDGFRPRREDLAGVLAALPVALRERSSRLLDQLEDAPEIDRARLRELEPLLSGGDPRRGREVFFGKRAPCSACHRVGSEGGQVGPDLTRIGAVRSGRDLLESIVVPGSTFAQGYETFAMTSTDGRISGGILASQTPEGIVLRDASGAEQAFRKEKIRSLERQPTSLMPEGLDRALSAEDLRDLLAFLVSLR